MSNKKELKEIDDLVKKIDNAINNEQTSFVLDKFYSLEVKNKVKQIFSFTETNISFSEMIVRID